LLFVLSPFTLIKLIKARKSSPTHAIDSYADSPPVYCDREIKLYPENSCLPPEDSILTHVLLLQAQPDSESLGILFQLKK
jgi:hypothetical protein